MPNTPHECDNGERQPDASQPSGGTPEDREAGRTIETHNRPITQRTDPEGISTGDDVA